MYVGGDGQQAIGYADRKFSGEAKEITGIEGVIDKGEHRE